MHPEKTGIPTAPISIYTSMEKKPFFPPRILNAQNTPKVCKVNGITVGTEIHEHTAIIAENTEIKTISRVLKAFGRDTIFSDIKSPPLIFSDLLYHKKTVLSTLF